MKFVTKMANSIRTCPHLGLSSSMWPLGVRPLCDGLLTSPVSPLQLLEITAKCECSLYVMHQALLGSFLGASLGGPFGTGLY